MRRAQPWLGTLVDIGLENVDAAAAGTAIDSAFAEVALVHRLMSFHDASSDIFLINRARPGDILAVHSHTWEVLHAAERIRKASQGAFNIACAPRLVEWGQLPAQHTGAPPYIPDRQILELRHDGRVLKLDDGWIDLGGIAKGYAVDLAITALRRHGISSGCVNAGGDLRVFGEQDYRIALRDPGLPARAGAEVCLRNEAMATSGTYFSRTERRGLTASALCNGITGQAIMSAGSVSVRAPSCMYADALTKVVLATGDTLHPALDLFAATALTMNNGQ